LTPGVPGRKLWLHFLVADNEVRHTPDDDYMQTVLPSEFKRQMVLMLDGAPHVIEEMHTSGTAQTRHKLHTRLRHLTTGRVIDRVFAESERVPVAALETRRVTFSYAQAEALFFIDIETFDEFEFGSEQLGERRGFLKENEEYKALRLDGRLLDIVLPSQIPLRVVDTAPPTSGGLNSAWKEAKLETGLPVMVPLFIANGDTVRIDTAEKKYLGKETAREY
jgi:elongation factor P